MTVWGIKVKLEAGIRMTEILRLDRGGRGRALKLTAGCEMKNEKSQAGDTDFDVAWKTSTLSR